MKHEANFYEKRDAGVVQCFLCAHQCVIAEEQFGLCGVRTNEHGVLYTYAYNEVVASHVDPIEKKPLYHFYPGSLAFSVATVGCNFTCSFCQNWQISQKGKQKVLRHGHRISARELVAEVVKSGAESIAYTYTEPTVFFEFAYDIAELAKKENIKNVFVTNGYMSESALDMIAPYLDGANVDLKSFSDAFYRKHCNARLDPVLETIRRMHEKGIWIEITTLLIEGENDSDAELKQIAEFIAQLSCDIPWHISAFHANYQMMDHHTTSLEGLKRARSIGHDAGLTYVYLGNVAEGGNTVCPSCGATVIKRVYYENEYVGFCEGACASCGASIAGVW